MLFMGQDTNNQFGLSCPLALPFNDDGSIEYRLFVAHAWSALDAGCSSVTVLGTTGEGASVSLGERGKMLGALLSAGINPRSQVVGGIAACSIGDAIQQIEILSDSGCGRILLAPPFYFKGVRDEGLYAWLAQVLEKIAHRSIGVILYHIPSVTQVPLSVDVIGRLKAAFPAVVIGDERHLAAGVRLGAKGAISGLANLCAPVLLPLISHGKDDSKVGDLVEAIVKYPVTPAVKALLSYRSKESRWLAVRPPLIALSPAEVRDLGAVYDGLFGG